ncbi:alpha/beta hydrolase [Sediminibacter sp. Hel_I_10]|uniref:alpha/beta hydrolase n=1 Tax=Sediminibacter sp. Hel_I_10 TaxID=1392490 RepID=UPI00047E6639|nr:alpha/beta hydrolase [Sediminibacter sp. Hel_I_10]
MRSIRIMILLMALVLCSCASQKHKNIAYLNTEAPQEDLKLNVFEPRDLESKRPVVIFVHGGNWNSGNKNTYGFLGRNLAKHDVITVIPSYTLSPQANFDTMASQVAQAFIWTRDHISEYGGDPAQIYLMGHSAGGHLIALVCTNPKYLDNPKAIKGVILNDAAGLDMYTYLQEHPPTIANNYRSTWTTNPELWKQASPVYHLSEEMPPFMIYVGTKSYESIIRQNATFLNALQEYQPDVTPIYLNKKHVPMMTQYFWPWSNRYDEVLDFIFKEKH